MLGERPLTCNSAPLATVYMYMEWLPCSLLLLGYLWTNIEFDSFFLSFFLSFCWHGTICGVNFQNPALTINTRILLPIIFSSKAHTSFYLFPVSSSVLSLLHKSDSREDPSNFKPTLLIFLQTLIINILLFLNRFKQHWTTSAIRINQDTLTWSDV